MDDEYLLINKYHAMTKDELSALWDEGNYPGPLEDYRAIEAALRRKLLGGVVPHRACPRCLSLTCICGKKNGERV